MGEKPGPVCESPHWTMGTLAGRDQIAADEDEREQHAFERDCH
jgi:hypothetical protein